MNERRVSKTKGGDVVIDESGWRASFIASPFTPGAYVLTAQSPDKRWFFGLAPETGYLIELRHKPNEARIGQFLTDCMSGKIVDKTMASLTSLRAPS